MEMSDRIQLIIKSHNLTASSFAEQLGVQRSSVSHLLSGRNKPSLDVLQKILTHFPRVNAEWLITGKQSQEQQIAEQQPEPEANATQEESTSIESSNKSNGSTIVSIVKFYADGTFDTYIPKN